jgi:hypothetical protein
VSRCIEFADLSEDDRAKLSMKGSLRDQIDWSAKEVGQFVLRVGYLPAEGRPRGQLV